MKKTGYFIGLAMIVFGMITDPPTNRMALMTIIVGILVCLVYLYLHTWSTEKGATEDLQLHQKELESITIEIEGIQNNISLVAQQYEWLHGQMEHMNERTEEIEGLLQMNNHGRKDGTE